MQIAGLALGLFLTPC